MQGPNSTNEISQVPGSHTWGNRTMERMLDGLNMDFKTLKWNEWRASEALGDKLYFVDKMQVGMA